MPYRQSDWHSHLTGVWGEYKSARVAVDRLNATVAANANLLADEPAARKYLRRASDHLEGTYIIRIFAAFEAALRSYDRWKHGDPTRETKSSVMIDEIGSKRGRRIQTRIRDGVHKVRRVRNYRAHELDADPGPMTVDQARGWLHSYLYELPEEWG